MKALTKQYIDGEFVDSYGREVMDTIRPTDRKVIGRITLADEFLIFLKSIHMRTNWVRRVFLLRGS
jgi:hypothetical protein